MEEEEIIQTLMILENKTRDEAYELFLKTKRIAKNYREGTIPNDFPTDILNNFVLRDFIIQESGYVVIDHALVRGLSDFIGTKKVLEICSGTGVLAGALKEDYVDIIPTDNMSWMGYTNSVFEDSLLNPDIEKIDGLEAIKKYGKDVDYILVSWCPYESDLSLKVLKLMRKINPDCKMIHIGESGCTDCDEFFDEAEFIEYDSIFNQIELKNWYGIYDQLSLIQ